METTTLIQLMVSVVAIFALGAFVGFQAGKQSAYSEMEAITAQNETNNLWQSLFEEEEDDGEDS